LDSWNFSLETGKLPPSYSESALTLLPKPGKNLDEIRNWRPITLTNCDQKIITKALANRMAKHLDSIIVTTQTAYVPGRSVMDNIRSNDYIKNYCEKNKVDGLLVSLDAKKAFDSVNHDYIRTVLRAYGIGEKFIHFFDVLYNDLSVKIIVNGYFSRSVRIERGVKQGDALSCSLFILCIDPLIRNINDNNQIKEVKLISSRSKTTVGMKCSGYADDIAIICRNDNNSIKGIFEEYERLTRLSGLELNAEKTEVLRIGHRREERIEIKFTYLGIEYAINSVDKLKICGIFFCNDKVEEYDLNILEKIERLESQLKRWMCRNLTMEGKILIIKTFGLSQLIYNLQCCHINEKDLVIIEKLMFKFIWSKNWEKIKTVERIKRSVLKNEYNNGGLNAPDIECMNRALKLKQFIRASNSKHCIKEIQVFCLEKLGYDRVIKQEYYSICKDDLIIKSGQESINLLTDLARLEGYGKDANGQSSKIAIEEVGSIYIPHYLLRKNKPMEACVFNSLKSEGIEFLSELAEEYEFNNDSKRESTIKFIRKSFPSNLLDIAENFNRSINDEKSAMTHFYSGNDLFIPVEEVTVKQLQSRLKIALKKVTTTDYGEKIGENFFDSAEIAIVRKQVKNVKLRNIFYRLINKDFFDRVKLTKYKIVENVNCERCKGVEDYEHLFWGCRWSKLAWVNYNIVISNMGLKEGYINSYKDIYNFNNTAAVNTIKLKIINELIQITRPTHLNKDYIENLIVNIKKMEQYIANKNKTINSFNKKWNCTQTKGSKITNIIG
jgi:hypothetical protein